MPDFLLEIGCEEIPARMIDAASLELRERVHKLLDRERLLPASALTLSRYASPPGGAGGGYSCRPAGCHRASDRAVGRTLPSKMASPLRQRMPSPKRPAWMFPSWNESQLRRANISPRRSRRKDAPPPRFWPSLCPKKSLRSTGPRTCTGASRASASCARCAGWWRCSMARSFRWSLTEFAPATSRADTGFWPTDRSRFRAPGRRMWRRCEKAKVLSREEREKQIRKALDAATRTIPGARWREDKSLLDTVVNLTEWPSAILGSFDPEFLELPEEVLVTVMRDHQKYFAVEDASGKLLAAFSGRAEYRRRSRRHHPAWPRTRAAGPLQRCALLLADRPEASAARARRSG